MIHQHNGNVQCSSCNRMRPVCNGNGSLETGFTWAQCQGCADIFSGKMSLDARAALRSVKTGISGAWKDSDKASAMEYAHEVRSAVVAGHFVLAARYLELAQHSAATRMAIQYMFTTEVKS